MQNRSVPELSEALRRLRVDHHKIERGGTRRAAEKFLKIVPEEFDSLPPDDRKAFYTAFRTILANELHQSSVLRESELMLVEGLNDDIRFMAMRKLCRVVQRSSNVGRELIELFVSTFDPERFELAPQEEREFAFRNLVWVLEMFPDAEREVIRTANQKLEHMLGRPFDSEDLHHFFHGDVSFADANLQSRSRTATPA